MSSANNPFISVIVTSYNYERYLSQTIESIINQTYGNFELIIVDDGSTDDSVELIKKYVKIDKRVKLYQHENGTNKKLAASVALAVSKASGDYVAFCESDDYWDKDYLQEKVNYIKENKNSDIIVNYPHIFGEEVEYKKEVFKKLFKILEKIKKPKNINFQCLKANGIVFPTFSIVMVKRENLQKCDFCPPCLKSAIDIWLWKQLLLNCNVGIVPKELTFWRIHKSSLSWNETHKEEWTIFFKELEKHLDYSFLKKLYLFIIKIENLIKSKMSKMFFQKKITKNNRLVIKILKIPVFSKKV